MGTGTLTPAPPLLALVNESNPPGELGKEASLDRGDSWPHSLFRLSTDREYPAILTKDLSIRSLGDRNPGPCSAQKPLPQETQG